VANSACRNVKFVSFYVALEPGNLSTSRRGPRGSHRAPPRRQVHPRDQGRPRPGRQAHSERRAQGHAPGRVDAPPEREGRPPREGPRTADSGPVLQRDRRPARRIEELRLTVGTRPSLPGKVQVRTQRAACRRASQVQRGPVSQARRRVRGRRRRNRRAHRAGAAHRRRHRLLVRGWEVQVVSPQL
jgi:hypothetical protein